MKLATQIEPEGLTFPAGQFKAKCLRLIDESNQTQQKVGVTKRGKLVGHFVPVAPEEKPFRSIFGRTPGVTLPSEKQWAKLKAEWADDWDESTKNLARLLNGKPENKKSKQR